MSPPPAPSPEPLALSTALTSTLRRQLHTSRTAAPPVSNGSQAVPGMGAGRCVSRLGLCFCLCAFSVPSLSCTLALSILRSLFIIQSLGIPSLSLLPPLPLYPLSPFCERGSFLPLPSCCFFLGSSSSTSRGKRLCRHLCLASTIFVFFSPFLLLFVFFVLFCLSRLHPTPLDASGAIHLSPRFFSTGRASRLRQSPVLAATSYRRRGET